MKINKIAKVYIQPIFCSRKLEVRYAEALIRPIKGGLTVKDILEYVDTNRLHIELDKFVLNESCRFIRTRNTKFKININMSKNAVETPGYYKVLLATLRKNNVSTQKIVFEVPETTDYNSRIVKQNIQGLVENGAKVAMDDFGSYNATINNLLKHNITMVKFDKSFLYNNSAYKIECTRRIVYSMNKLGIDTVIEGVETPEHIKISSAVGYKYMQGFLLGKPIAIDYYRESI